MNKDILGDDNGAARTDMAQTAMARSHVYGLLATIFRAEPTEALLKELKDPRMSGAFSDLGVSLGEEFFGRPEKELVEELAVEYARLFLGPGRHISPHESVHHEVDGGDWGLLWGQETVKVKQFMESAGLAYAANYNGVPDHISVELEFLQKLALREATAWAEEDIEGALYGLKMEKMFIRKHLIKWVPLFCDKVIAFASAPFYREMAEVTKGFVQFEQEKMEEYLSLARQADDE